MSYWLEATLAAVVTTVGYHVVKWLVRRIRWWWWDRPVREVERAQRHRPRPVERPDVEVVATGAEAERRINDEWAAIENGVRDGHFVPIPDPPNTGDVQSGPAEDTTIGSPESADPVINVKMAKRAPTSGDRGSLWVDLSSGKFYLNDDADGWAQVACLPNTLGGGSVSVGDELNVTVVMNTMRLPRPPNVAIEDMEAAQRERGRVEWEDLSEDARRWLGALTLRQREDFATLFCLSLPEGEEGLVRIKKARPRRMLDI